MSRLSTGDLRRALTLGLGLALLAFSAYAGSAYALTIIGTDGHDVIYGTDNDDNIYAKGGDDEAYAHGGGDYVEGGTGADYVAGQDNRDEIHGQAGFDRYLCGGKLCGLEGTDKDDSVYGGDGEDALGGGSGNDSLNGQAGADNIFSTDGQTDVDDGGDGQGDFCYADSYDIVVRCHPR